MDSVCIQTKHLTKKYGKVTALRGVNATIPRGRIVALLGPNGAGKSTFLKLALGLLEPTAGNVRVFGEDARELGAVTCGRIASILDGHEPPAWATMRMLVGLQAEATAGFDAGAARALLEERGLSPGRRYGRLSKGQRRYALTCLCLTGGADLLLLDEPADGLDTQTRRELYDRIRDQANERETTVILATHHIYDIERVADDVLLLENGRLTLHESLESLREQMREIVVAPDNSPPDWRAGVEVVRKLPHGDSTAYYVRLPEGAATAQLHTSNGAPAEHHVDLETLYLALTQGSRPETLLSLEEAMR